MNHNVYRFGILALGALLHFGCSGGKDDGHGSAGNGEYVSANPGQPGGRAVDEAGGLNGGSTGSSGTGGSTAGPTVSDGSGDDASRDIEEADIIKLDGDRLYALSQYGGLSVIDVGTHDKLALLGRFKTDAMPFEMYLRDNVVLGLFNDYGTYDYDEATATWSWIQSSRILALDVSDPQHIETLASFPIPGSISDSRIVGDVLYVVGYEGTGCWGCETNPGTTILSIDISDPQNVTQVDRLRYVDANTDYGWYRRSVTVTEDRMYVAGVEYSSTGGNMGSTINVVDISDPSGSLIDSGSVEAEGEITSRWQMDEYDGVLRVLSQPPQWNLALPPVVQTFSIGAQNSLTPLGSTQLALPANEQLQSVRFDGPRGYAITFLQTDPLFTIDLSNPAAPVQAGTLQMPGYLYHMEPRGDRLIGLGFDQGNPAGSITVSLFDVSNLSAPTMLDRVNFGGDWGSFPEDQDRIHKAFNVLDDIGTILVPFSGYDYDTNGYCGSYNSGVQLIDWSAATDDLTLRGLAQSVGQARRGFLFDDRLFTVSDERVQTFDIADRDAPQEKANLTLITNITKSAIVGDHVVRLSTDWWTSAPRLEVTTLADAENPVPLGELDLGSVFDNQRTSCYSWSYPRNLFSNGQYAYLVYDTYAYYGDYYVDQNNHTTVVVVDVSDPTKPTLVGQNAVSMEGYPGSSYSGNLAPSGKDIVQVGSTLAMLSSDSACADTQCTHVNVSSFVNVFDLSDPTKPASSSLRVPVGLGNTGLVTSGNLVALSHYEALNAQATQVKFYIDQIDVSDASHPVMLPKKNIPGSLLAYDAENSGAVTVDYQAVSISVPNSTECYSSFGYSSLYTPAIRDTYDGPGRCDGILQSLNLVRFTSVFATIDGKVDLGRGRFVAQSAVGDDRTFVTLQTNYYYGYGVGVSDGGYGGYYTIPDVKLPLIVIGGLSSGNYAKGELQIQGGDYWSYSGLVASGQRALLSTGWRGKLSVVDASVASAPEVVTEVPIHGYVSDIDVSGNTVLLSLGSDGTALVDL